MDRRTFAKISGLTGMGTGVGLVPMSACQLKNTKPMALNITHTNSNFERAPLLRPFGFKGSAMTNVWQTMAMLQDETGLSKVGLGTQNVLWSDANVFASHSEVGGNAMMFAMMEHALKIIRGKTFSDPHEMLDFALPEVLNFGKEITGRPNLRTTFALNALVAVDNAAWLLYCALNDIGSFDDMLPSAYKKGLSARHDRVVSIPALGYGTSMEEIKRLADDGYFIMKIKIGAPGTQAEMVEKDKEFLSAIHRTIGHYETKHTEDGKLPYYFDPNGRYDSHDDILRFLDHAEKIGALDQIAVLEEPFGERNQSDVSAITARNVRVAADESAHTDQDTRNRIDQGYNAIAVKAIAKTMSMTMRIAQVAFERDVPCFCADLTVNPILVDWNKTVAARLPAFPELPGMGLQETNGWQNYEGWSDMLEKLPDRNAPWVNTVDGVYPTGATFFERSGGIFDHSKHYQDMFGL
ncbi:MAG: hypothetical protein KTR24_16620 [Saprospiraceae bacterium]|nr:hypothetical protein [Saprospiraceae bacterium]